MAYRQGGTMGRRSLNWRIFCLFICCSGGLVRFDFYRQKIKDLLSLQSLAILKNKTEGMANIKIYRSLGCSSRVYTYKAKVDKKNKLKLKGRYYELCT